MVDEIVVKVRLSKSLLEAISRICNNVGISLNDFIYSALVTYVLANQQTIVAVQQNDYKGMTIM